ncbi:MAG: DUF4350 domain-containing protein [Pseudomonadota bacterium]
MAEQTSPAAGGGSPFSGGVVAAILGVAGVSFLLAVVLMAWSPELQSKNRAGLHPYSTSALGYQGLVRLLELREVPVSISRSPQRLRDDYDTLKVLTLTPYGMGSALDDLSRDLVGPALVVLPKWSGFRDAAKPEWQERVSLLGEAEVQRSIRPFDSDAEVWRLRTPATVRASFGKFTPDFGDDMQVLRADSLVSIVSVPGGDLVAKLPDRDVYILSDPDLLNTSGLAKPGNAEMALTLISFLRDETWRGDAPVILDATLHGFERSENVLQLVFDIPFIGATLVALAAFLMIGWSGAVRFGTPLREERAFALGKQALTDNTAALVVTGRREARMAPGYLSLVRRATAKAVGAPKSLSEAELTDLFDRLGEGQDIEASDRFSTLEAGLNRPAASRQDLLDKARRLWRWQKEITHGHQ